MSRPIRIAHLDDHPAILAGLEAITASMPDLRLVGSVRSERELLALVRRARLDVVVIDLHHPGRDGLELCLKIRHELGAPAVIIYTATATDTVTVAAALAGAGEVVSKASPPAILLGAIRGVAHNPLTRPAVSAQMRREAAQQLDSTDHAILAMRLAGEPPAAIGHTLGLLPHAALDRIAAIISRLEPVSSAAVGNPPTWTRTARVA